MNSLRPIRERFIHFVFLLAGLAWIWLSRAVPGSTTAGEIPAPRPGFVAPDFTLTTLSGEQVSLSKYHGRPIVLNFWASWCPPCRAEMPALQEAYAANSERGLVILAVNAAAQDNLSSVRAFVAQYNLSFPVPLDTENAANQLYEIRSLPTTFFITSDGKIQEMVIGGPLSRALLQIRIQDLINGEKSP